MIAKRSKTERALIGTTAGNRLAILATDGAWIGSDVYNICDGAEDVGLVDAKDCPEPGLYLWEGHGELTNGGPWDGPPEPETVYHGTVRRVRPDELEELYRMTPPEPQEAQE